MWCASDRRALLDIPFTTVASLQRLGCECRVPLRIEMFYAQSKPFLHCKVALGLSDTKVLHTHTHTPIPGFCLLSVMIKDSSQKQMIHFFGQPNANHNDSLLCGMLSCPSIESILSWRFCELDVNIGIVRRKVVNLCCCRRSSARISSKGSSPNLLKLLSCWQSAGKLAAIDRDRTYVCVLWTVLFIAHINIPAKAA